jgi:hypothetical protein
MSGIIRFDQPRSISKILEDRDAHVRDEFKGTGDARMKVRYDDGPLCHDVRIHRDGTVTLGEDGTGAVTDGDLFLGIDPAWAE